VAIFDDVRRKVLANGLEVLVREDHSSPVAALNFFVRVGSLNEDDAIAGWSHGIEHMLFKGTTRRKTGDIAREIADAGGETNAGTGYESTNYYIILPSENVATALDIHADVLRNSTFDEVELENERQVLIKENEMYRDRPSGFGHTWESLLAEAFTVHRYRRPIGGPDENLLRVGRAEILRHKETYYVPNNITYVVVGDVDAQAVFSLIEEKLGDWPRRAVVPDLPAPEPRQDVLRYAERTGDVEKSYVKIGFHIPRELDPETDALMVLGHVLASGRSSRLYRRVREEMGLILSSHVMETTGKEPGYMVVEFEAEPAKRDEALVEVMAEILRFAREPVSDAELERTLRAVRSDTLYTLESMEGQAQMLGHYALLDDYRLAGEYLDRLSRVTPRLIQEAARRHLDLDRATVFAYGPAGRPPLAADARALRQTLEAGLASRLPAQVTAARDVTLHAPLPAGSGGARREMETAVLTGGCRVLLQHDGRLPLVAMAVYLPVGSGAEGAAQAGITRLVQNGMMKGSAGRSASEIAETIDRMGARIRPFSGRDLSGYSLSAVREDFPEAAAVLRDILTRPDFPEEAVARERDRTLAEIASLRDETVQYTVTEFYRLLFPGHAYGRPSLGEEESVRRLGRDDLVAWHRRHYDPARTVVSVVGDFDRDAVLAILDETLARFPGKGEGSGEVPPVSTPSKPVRHEIEQDVTQAVVVLGYPGPPLDSPDRYPLEVWNGILSGMGNRLFTRLRDEQHLCYFTGAFVSPFLRGGVVGAYVGTGPEQVDDATASLLAELEGSTRGIPSKEELIRAKNNLAGTYLIDMQTRMSWASAYAQNEIEGVGWEETLRYLDRIREVTAEQVRECAARYVRSDRLVVAVLRPSRLETAAAGGAPVTG
jgi:zinc protease